MVVLGIDPGLSGGVAVVRSIPGQRPQLMEASDILCTGEKAKRRVDVIPMMEWIRQHNPDHAVIERAQAMPDQGASSGFIYGRAVGALEAIIEGLLIPHTVIESTAWKKAHGLTKTSKEDSRQRALKLFPGVPWFARKLDHNRAEAALMAWFGLMLLREVAHAESDDSRNYASGA